MTGLHRGTCDFIKLVDTPLVVGVPAKHPLHVQQTISLECLAGEEVVMFRLGLSAHADVLRKYLMECVYIIDKSKLLRHNKKPP